MGVASWLERASNQSALSQTDTVLVAVSSANHFIRVHWVFFASEAAMTCMLESGTANRLWEMYPDASGGAALIGDPDMVLFEGNAGESLTYTTSQPGNHFIAVGYTEINV